MLSRPTIAPGPGSPDAAGCALLEPRSVPSLPDRALASAASVGDRAAFEEIVRRHAPDMLRYATHLLSDRTTAEDVVQDALVDAWRGLRTFRADSSLRTWLYSVVSHKVVDQHRRRVPTPVEDWVFERPSRHHDDDPTIATTQKAFLGALDEALSELPYRQRACWLLHEVEGMRHTEIGTVMSLSPGAVRGHLTRARTTLSRRLETWT